jgi:hypothetical protein
MAGQVQDLKLELIREQIQTEKRKRELLEEDFQMKKRVKEAKLKFWSEAKVCNV